LKIGWALSFYHKFFEAGFNVKSKSWIAIILFELVLFNILVFAVASSLFVPVIRLGLAKMSWW
jgi:hypothetical protein